MRGIPPRQGAMGHMDKSAGCKTGSRKGELSGKKEKRKSVYEVRRLLDEKREEGSSTRRGRIESERHRSWN